MRASVVLVVMAACAGGALLAQAQAADPEPETTQAPFTRPPRTRGVAGRVVLLRRGNKDRSTSSSSGDKDKKSSDDKSKGGDGESLGMTSDSKSSSGSDESKSREKHYKKDKNKNMPKSTIERHGWRKWHRKCTRCPEEMKLKWRDPRIKWICGGYQRARRSFKSLCLMHLRNCQDGTMFTKIHDHRCANDTGSESQPHGEHFFYDYKAKLSEESSKSESGDSSDESDTESESSKSSS